MLEHDGKFYLFVSFDQCCKGVASTYNIRVGRADRIEGPYLDKDGKPMLEAAARCCWCDRRDYRAGRAGAGARPTRARCSPTTTTTATTAGAADARSSRRFAGPRTAGRRSIHLPQ